MSLPILGQQGAEENLTIRTDESIIIDGLLNELIWDNAPEANSFIQINPNRTDPGKIKTTVKILYDDNFVYFGFLCYDTEPDEIKPGAINIDGDLRDTDSIYILIDTLSDTRNFFYFAVNYIGSKSDGIILKGGRSVNYNWNGSWESFSQKTDFGWSTEVAIKLSSIIANPEENRTFGLSLSRVVPRLEISIFQPNPLDPAFDMGELRELKTLKLFETDIQIMQEQKIAEQIEQGKRAIITSYVSSKLESGEKVKPAAGIEASYAFSPQMIGQLAINPDFETVEPDHELVNLTPFEIYLSERRSFFQMTSAIYLQPLGLFYSKRIGDIYGGVKLNRISGGSEFSFMSAQTKKDELLNKASSNFSVFSYKKKNIGNFLTIGITAANKFTDKKNKGTAGIEADITFSDKLRFSSQYALSYGDYGENNTAFFLGPSYDSDTLHIHFHYKQIDKYFGDNANYVGFIPDDNRKELDSAINKTFSLRKGIFRQIRYRSNYNIYWGMDGTLRSWQIDEGISFDTNNKFSLSAHHTMEYKLNEFYLEPLRIYDEDRDGWINLYTRDYRNSLTKFTSSYYGNERQQFSLYIAMGQNYGSKIFMFGISKKLAITKNIFSEYDFYRIRYIDGFLFENTYIHVIKLTIDMSENISGTIFYQSNTGIEKANFQVVFSYAFKPSVGFLQFIYQKGNPDFGAVDNQGDAILLKLVYII